MKPAIKEPSRPRRPAEPPSSEEPKGPRTPYPVNEPVDPHGPGSEPGCFPGKPAGGDLPTM